MSEKDYADLAKIISYDPNNGTFIWLSSSTNKRREKGQTAGTIDKNGYRIISYNYNRYKAHRLAYYIMTGDIPEVVDHKNTKTGDNRWDNLREASYSQNAFNQKPRQNTSSKLKGVSKIRGKRCRPWKATITINNSQTHLGYFDTEDKASRAYQTAAIKNHGEFKYEETV